ncbi:MAG: O-antigen ligase family protein [Spirochaetota bacterium]
MEFFRSLKTTTVHQWYLHCITLSIVCIALSVSLSQLFLFLSFTLFLFDKQRSNIQASSILYVSLAIFALYALSIVYNLSTSSPNYGYLQRIPKSELKDMFLFSGFVAMLGLQKEDFHKVARAFWILTLVSLVIGLISIFSPIRLNRLINDWINPSNLWRLTQHYGNIGPIALHLPIGLMSTHLTFGGQLLLLLPGIFFYTLDSLQENGFRAQKTLYYLSIFILFCLLTLFNNARSAMLGMGIAGFLGLVDLGLIKKQISLRFLRKILMIPSTIVCVLLVLLLSNDVLQKTIRPLLGGEKHTDSGRTFIWSSTFPMITQNPLIGIGPGNYETVVEKVRKQLSTEYRELLFFYEVTQRGHAHNDVLHLAAIAGIPTAILYISLCGLLFWYISHLQQYKQYVALFYGLLGFFFAGLLQCYFQDDEVVILFWFLLGFLNRLYLQEMSPFDTSAKLRSGN